MFYAWIIDLLLHSPKTGCRLTPSTNRILIGYVAGRGKNWKHLEGGL